MLAVSGRASLGGEAPAYSRGKFIRVGNFVLRVGDRISFLTASGWVSGTANVENDFLATDSIVVFDVISLPNAWASIIGSDPTLPLG